VPDDDEWALAKQELYPAASLARIGVNAKFTVGMVSLVGTGFSALGLATASELGNGPAANLAYAAAAVAFCSVVCALSYLGLRLSRANPQNLDEVKRWYNTQFRRAWLALLASWLLVLAVLLAGAAAGVAVVAPQPSEPVLALTRTTGSDATLSAKVTVTDLAAADVVHITVTGPGKMVVLRGSASPDAQGTAILESTAAIRDEGTYRMVVEVNGDVKKALDLP
jgi:hypothetical protein